MGQGGKFAVLLTNLNSVSDRLANEGIDGMIYVIYLFNPRRQKVLHDEGTRSAAGQLHFLPPFCEHCVLTL